MIILTDDIDALSRLATEALRYFKVAQIIEFKRGHLVARWDDGAPLVLTRPNAACIGIICMQAVSGDVERLLDWWLDHCDIKLPVCNLYLYLPAAEKERALILWLCRGFGDLLAEMIHQNKDLIRQNSALRSSYGALQQAFSHLEHFIVSNSLQVPVLRYEAAPIVAFWTPSAEEIRLRQILPVLSTEFSFMEVYFRRPLRTGSGALRAALLLEPRAITLQTWEISYRDLGEGWNVFAPPPYIGDSNELVLVLEWSDPDGAPSVGLSSAHWNKALGVVSEANKCRALAMRVWSGLPGIRPPVLASTAGRADLREPQVVNMAPDVLSKARQYVMPKTVKKDYASVKVLEDSGRLQVHPHGPVPTIAVMPSVIPPNAAYVSAECRTVHPESAQVEYAMAALTKDISPEAVFDGDLGASAYFSGWKNVKPGEARRITLLFENPATGSEFLCFATRLEPQVPDAFAWATWGGVEFGFGRRTWLREMEILSATKAGEVAPASVIDEKTVRNIAIASAAGADFAERDRGGKRPPDKQQRALDSEGVCSADVPFVAK